MTPQPTPITPDVIGRYEVVRLLGLGAMGRVLLAHDPVLDREVAIKLLRDDLALPPEMRDALWVRMQHEARAAARVSHPNLVTLHDMGELDGLGPYLVFEYVPGSTLRDRIDAGPLPLAEVARLARQLGSALSAAHAAGVVHRDVKPDNVLLAPTGAKLTDFGIARVPDSTLTRAGGLLGTPAYSAPEALAGGTFSALSDQFSLAATMYEAVAHARAFPGDDAVSVVARIASASPDRVAARLSLPPEVDTVLGRAMSLRPDDRFSSCAAFGAALAEALESTRPDGGWPGASPRSPEPPIGRMARVALGGAALGGVLVALASAGLRSGDADPLAPVADRSAALPSATPPPPRASAAATPPRARPRPLASASAAPSAAASADPPPTPDAGPDLDPEADAGQP